jgi:hypothetical protein
MAISFVGASPTVTGASVTVAVPAGVQAGDLLIISTVGGSTAITIPTGWSTLVTQAAGTVWIMTTLYKFATASETSVALNTNSTGQSAMIAYRGVSAINAIAAFNGTNNSASPTTPTLTTTAANAWVLSFYINQSGSGRTWTANASTTARVTASTTTALVGMLVADELKASTGLSTARAATISAASNWSAAAVALTPTPDPTTRYWVGGSSTWDTSSTTNWSASSGGAGGASVPRQVDSVVIDANSGSPTITMTGALVCASLTTTGATCVLTSTGSLSMAGNLTLSATTTWSASGGLTFTTTGTVTTNGVTINSPVTFNGASQTFTLGSALTVGATLTTTFTAGTLALSTFTLSTGFFNSNNANTRVLSFGTGNITCNAAGGTLWDTSTVTGFSFTGTSQVNISNNSATATTVITGAATEAQALNFNYTTGTYTLTDTSAIYKNVNWTGFTGTVSNSARTIYGNWTNPSSGIIWTAGANTQIFAQATGTQTITSNGVTLDFPISRSSPVTSTLQLASALTLGSTRLFTLTYGTLDLNNFTLTTGSFNSSASGITRAIAFGTTGAITCTGSGTVFDIANANSFTYSGTSTVNISNNSATPTTVNIGAFSETQALNFNYTTGTYTLTDTGARYKNVNWTGFAGTATNSARIIYGNWTNPASGITWTAGANATSFSATAGTQTFTTNAVTLDFPVTKSGAGTLVLGGALTIGSTRTFTVSAGTFTPGFDVTAGLYSLTGGTVNMGSYTWTASGTGAVWTRTSATISAGTSTIALSDTSATAVTFAGGGATYNNLSLTGVAGTGTLTITGANTFNTLASSRTGIYTITLPASTTTTISTWSVAGANASTNYFTLNSSTPGTAATLSVATGTVNPNYAKIQDITATGGATFTATTASNLGNNTGWTFSNRYWVSGTGTWDTTTTTNWAVTSGGAGGNFVPTSFEDVFFNANSGSGTVTLTGALVAKSLDTTGSSFTFTSTGTPTVAGGMTLSATTVWSATGLITFTATGTITTNSVTLSAPVTFNGASQTFTLGGNLTVATTQTTTFTNGTLNLSTFTLSTGLFSSNNSNTRVLAFGTGAVTVTGSGAAFDMTTVTGFSYTGTPTVNISNNSATATTVNTGLLVAGTALNFNYTTGTYTLTDASAVYNNVNFTGFGGTVSNQTRSIYGNWTNPASGITFSAGSNVQFFSATSGTQTITSNAVTFDFPITKNAAGTLQLPAALTLGITRLFTFTAGTLDLNNFTLTTGLFNANISTTRTIAFGTTGAITCNAAGGTLFDMTTNVGFSYTGTSTINISNNSASTTTVVTGAMTEAQALNFNYTTGTYVLTDTSAVYKNINFTGFTGTVPNSVRTIYGNWTNPASGGTYTAGTSAQTFAATTGTQTITTNARTLDFAITKSGVGGTLQLPGALTLGSTRTFVLTGGTLDLNNVTLTTGLFNSNSGGTRAITFGTTGAVTVNGSGTVFNMTTVTGFSYTGTSTINISNNSATATTVITGTPTEAQALSFNYTTGTYTLTDTSAVYKNINLTGFAGTFPNSVRTIYGNWTNPASGGTYTAGANAQTFSATSGTQTITSNGRTLDFPITQSGSGGTLVLGGALTIGSTRTFTVSAGTFTPGFDVTAGLYSLTGGTVNMSTYTWTVSGTNWSVAGATIAAGTSTIAFSDTSTTSLTFAGGGATYNNLSLTGVAGTGTLTITGANTFNTLASSRTGIYTVTLPASTTTTISTWSVAGTNTTSNYVTLNSSSAGTQATLSVATGTVNPGYAKIQDSAAIGGATFTATTASNLGNNTGWTFATGVAGRYWVGGTGTWDTTATTNWSFTSGGAGGAFAPTSAEDVFFNANSGSGTITLTGALTAKSLDTTGSSFTFSSTGTPTISGGMTLSATTVWSATGVITFIATGTVTTNGVSLGAPVTINGTGITTTLGSALTTTSAVTLTAGTVTLNGFDITCLTFSSNNSNTRSVAFGANYINITTTATATVLDITTATGFTPTGAGGFKLTGAAASAITRTVVIGTTGGSATTAPNVSVTAGAAGSIVAITTASWVQDLNFTGFSGTFAPAAATTIAGSLTAVAGMTWTTGTGTITFAATATGKTITSAGKSLYAVTFNGVGGGWSLQDTMTATNLLTLTAGTVTLNGFDATCLTFNSNNSNARGVAFGTNYVNITSTATTTVLDITTATAFTPTGAGGFKLTGAAASAITRTVVIGTTGGAASTAPNVSVAAGAAGSIFALTTASWIGGLDFTGFSGTWSPATNTTTFSGSLTLVSGMTLTTGTGAWTFAGASGIQTITSAGKTLGPLVINNTGTSVQLQDNLTVNSTLTFTQGTLDLNARTTTGITTVTFATGPSTVSGGTLTCTSVTHTSGSATLGSLTTTGAYTFTAGTITLTGTLTCASFSSSNANTRTIAFSTNNITINGTGTVWNMAALTGFTYTGTPTVNISNNSATAATVTMTGATATNALNFNVTTGTYALTLSTNATIGSLNFTGFTGTWAPTTQTATFYGALTLVSGMTLTAGTGAWTFAGASGIQAITSAGKTLGPLVINNTGTSVQLQDNLTTNSTLTFTQGTLDLNARTTTGITTVTFATGPSTISGGTLTCTSVTHTSGSATLGSLTTTGAYTFTAGTITLTGTLTCASFSSANSNTRAIAFGTSNITVNGTGTVWSMTASGFTYTGTPTVNISNNSSTAASVNMTGATATNALNFNVTTGTYALTTTATVNALNFTGFTGSTTGVDTTTIYGNVTLVSGMTVSGTGVWTFGATSGTQTITCAGKTITNPITVNNTGSSLQLQDTFSQSGVVVLTAGAIDLNNQTNTFGTITLSNTPTVTISNGSIRFTSVTQNSGTVTLSASPGFPLSVITTGTYTFTTGTLDVSSYSLSTGLFSSTGNVARSISFGATGGSVTTTGSGTVWDMTDPTNFSYTGTSTVNISNNSAVATTVATGTPTEAQALNFNYTTGTYTLTETTARYKNVNWTGFGGTVSNQTRVIYGNWTNPSTGIVWSGGTLITNFSAATANQTITSNGVTLDFPITRSTGTGTLQLAGALTLGSTRTFLFTAGCTLDLNNVTLTTGLFSSSTSATRVLAFGTTGAVTVTGAGATMFNMSTATNFSYTGTPTINISNNSATAATVTTGAVSEAQAMNFNYTTGTYLLTESGAIYKNINWTGFGTAVPNTARTIYGNWTNSAGTTFASGSNAQTFAATSGTQTITTNAVTLDFPITQNGSGGTVQLPAAVTLGSTRTFTLTTGTLDLNTFTLTTGLFSSTNSNTRAISFGTTGTVTTTGSGSVFDMTTVTGFSYTGTNRINISNNSSTAASVVTGAFTAATAPNFNVTVGTYALTTTATVGSLNFTGFTGSTSGVDTTTIYGNVILVAGMTVSGTGVWSFRAATGTQTITCATRTITNPITVNNTGSSLQLQDTFSQSGVVTLTAGAIDLNNQTNTFGTITLTGTPTVTITNGSIRFTSVTQSSGTVTLSASPGFPLSTITTGTYTFTSGTLDVSSYSLSTGLFSSNNLNTRSISFGTTGAITTTGSGTVWDLGTAAPTGFSYTGTSTVNISNNSATATTVATGLATEAQAMNFNYTTGTYALTDTAARYLNVNWTGFAGTVSNQTRIIYGNWTNPSTGITWTGGTNVTSFSAATANQTITTNGVTLDFPITRSTGTGTLQLAGALTLGTARTFTFTAGCILDLNNFILTTGLFSSNTSTTRTISFGTTGAVTTTGSGTVFNMATATNFAYTGTSTINISNNSATAATVNTGAVTEAQALNFNYTTGTYPLTETNAIYKNINWTGFGTSVPNTARTIYGNWTNPASITTFASGSNAQTFAATSGTQTITTNGVTLDFPITQNGIGGTVQLPSAVTLGTTQTFTLTNGTLNLNNFTLTTGLFSSTNSNVRVISFGTTGTVTTTGSGSVFDMTNPANFSYTGTNRINISNNSSTAASVTTGAFTAVNALNFNFTTGTYALTTTGTVGSLNFTGFAGSTSGVDTTTIYGNVILVAGMTVSGTGVWSFRAATGTQTITCAGKTITNPITVNNTGSSLQLQDTFSQSGAVTLTAGAIDLNNQTNTFGTITLTGTPTVTITNGSIRFTSVTQSSGTVTLSASPGFPLSTITTGTYTFSTGTLDVSSYSLSTGLFSSTGNVARVIAFGTTGGSVTTTGSGTVWDMPDPLNFSYTGTSNVNISNNSAVATTVNTGSTSIPTEAQAMNFNYTTGTYALTDVGARYKNVNWTGFGGTVSNQTRIIYGNWTNPASGITWTGGTNVTSFSAATANQTITSNGVLLDFPITRSTGTGTLQLAGALTLGTARTFLFTANCTLDLNNVTLTTGLFSSSTSATRVLAFGTTGAITTTGSGATMFNMSNPANFSYTGTPTINISNNSATAATVTTGAATEAQALNFNYTTGTYLLTESGAIYKNINWTGFGTAVPNTARTIYGNWTNATGTTFTAGSSAQTFAATSGTQTITTNGVTLDFPITQNGIGGTVQLPSAVTLGTTQTFTLTSGTLDLNNFTLSTGLFSSTNSNVRVISFGTTGTVTTTGSGSVFDMTNPANFSYTGTNRINISNNSSTAASVTTGAFTAVNALNFNFTTGIYLLTMTATVGSLNFTGFTGSTSGVDTTTIYGNVTLVSGMTVSGTGVWSFRAATGTQTITCAGKTITNPITVNNTGSSLQLQDTFSQSGAVVLTAGAIDLNNQTNTFGTITLTGTPTVTISNGSIRFTSVTQSSGTVTLSASPGFPLSTITTGTYTFNSGTLDVSSYSLSTGLFSSPGTGTRVIAFGTTGAITTTGSGTVWDMPDPATGASFSYTGTSTINISNNSAVATTVNTGSTSVPTEAQAMNFNYTTGTYTLTDTIARYKNVNWTGFAGTVPNSVRVIYGNWTNPSTGIVWTGGTNAQTFGAATANQTITSNGVTLDFPITRNTGTGTLQLAGALTLGSTRTFLFTAGCTLDLNNVTLTTGLFSSSTSATRVLAFGTTGAVTVTGAGATMFNMSTATNFSYTGTPTINISNNSATAATVTTGAVSEAQAMNFNYTTGTYLLTESGAIYKNINWTGFGTAVPNTARTIYGNWTNPASVTTFASGSSAQTFAATSGTQTITTNGVTLDFPITQNGSGGTVQLPAAVTLGTTQTFTLTSGTLNLNNFTLSTGLFSSTNSNTRTISFGTTGAVTTTGSGSVFNMTTVTGFSYTGTSTINISNNSATAATVTTGAVTEAQALNFNYTTGTYALTETNAIYKNINWTGFGTSVPNTARTIYGNWTNATGTTFTAGAAIQTFGATSGTQTITTNGVTLDFPVTKSNDNSTLTLGGDLTIGSSRTFTISLGTFTPGYNITAGLFSLTGTINMGSNTWTASGTGSGWNVAAGAVINAGTSTIIFSDTSTTTKTFVGSGKTYNNLQIGPAAGIASYVITGSNTFNTVSSTKTVAYTITLPASTTTTVSNWTAGGATPGNRLTLNSSTAGTQSTLALAGSGIAVGGDYMSIQDINFTPTPTGTQRFVWYVGPNSTFGTNVTGSALRSSDVTQIGYILTSGTAWTVPSDWSSYNNRVYLVGGGAGGAGSVSASGGTSAHAGGAGGGGGGFTTAINVALTSGASVVYAIGAAGTGGTGGIFSSTSGAGGATTFNSGAYAAGGGGSATTSTSTSTGGTAGTGTTANGGAGGAGAGFGNATYSGGGGGGAGGIDGAGVAGGAAVTFTPGAGGAGDGNVNQYLSIASILYGRGATGATGGATSPGIAATGYGGGGSGAGTIGSTSQFYNGGDGTQGVIFVLYTQRLAIANTTLSGLTIS